MARHKRPAATIAGTREAAAIAATLGREMRVTRLARRLTQTELGQRVDLSQSEISHLELGDGQGTPLATWIAIGIALGRPLAVGFSREIATSPPADAGHLAAQELVLRLAERNRWDGHFELPTRPSNPSLSVDVCLRDRRNGILYVIEIWNRLDDLGAAARSMTRKTAEALDLAAFREPPDRVAGCWLLVDSAANRALVRTYPSVLRARFSGSSAGWVRALEGRGAPPHDPGLAWIDVRSGRLAALRIAAVEASPGGAPAGRR